MVLGWVRPLGFEPRTNGFGVLDELTAELTEINTRAALREHHAAQAARAARGNLMRRWNSAKTVTVVRQGGHRLDWAAVMAPLHKFRTQLGA